MGRKALTPEEQAAYAELAKAAAKLREAQRKAAASKAGKASRRRKGEK